MIGSTLMVWAVRDLSFHNIGMLVSRTGLYLYKGSNICLGKTKIAKRLFLFSLFNKYFDFVEKMNTRPLVVCGPSGCGKSTLVKKLMQEYPDKFGFSVSHTTRSPRTGEVHGKDYYFTEREVMQRSIDAGDFIESAEYNRNLYGTSKKAVQDVVDSGKVCILDIDMQGVKNMKQTNIDCLYLFTKAPSLGELERRLRRRGTETDDSLRRRLEIADKELAYAAEPGSYDYVIVNDDFDMAYSEFKKVINKEIISLS